MSYGFVWNPVHSLKAHEKSQTKDDFLCLFLQKVHLLYAYPPHPSYFLSLHCFKAFPPSSCFINTVTHCGYGNCYDRTVGKIAIYEYHVGWEEIWWYLASPKCVDSDSVPGPTFHFDSDPDPFLSFTKFYDTKNANIFLNFSGSGSDKMIWILGSGSATTDTSFKNWYSGQLTGSTSVAEPKLFIFGSGSTFVPYFGSGSSSSSSHKLPLQTVL